MSVCMAVPGAAGYRRGGGAFLWLFLNWALGLRAAGCRVLWLEATDGVVDRQEREVRRKDLATLNERLGHYGLTDSLVVASFADGLIDHDLADRYVAFEAAAEADLLLNFCCEAPATFVNRFRRSALVDIDPGLLQTWVSRGELAVADHDVYLTIGETVGTAAAGFSTCGLPWQYSPPPVYLPEWPPMVAADGAPYTTVSGWWDQWMELEGEDFSNEKRTAFLEYVDLPSHTSARLELAIVLDDYTRERDVPLLQGRGWGVADAWTVCDTPETYRRYVQQSRGEFTCARPSSARLVTTWISDRTLCYLASGKPAVIQQTAPTRYPAEEGGLVRFQSLDEAAAALDAIEADYERHARAARKLVEEHFDAEKVARRVLEIVFA